MNPRISEEAKKSVIVLPTYNERENMLALIPAIFTLLPDISILIVDDNSPDGTGEVVKRLMERYPTLKLLMRRGKEGLGKAYVHGFREALKDARVQTIVMMDGDLSHDPASIPRLLELRASFDLVIGSRYILGGETSGWELWRWALSRGGNIYARTILGVPFHDCTTGFNAISASLLHAIDFGKLNLSGYAFIMHLKYLLYKAGARVTEIPITYKNRTAGKSKISNHIIAEGVLAPWKMLFGR